MMMVLFLFSDTLQPSVMYLALRFRMQLLSGMEGFEEQMVTVLASIVLTRWDQEVDNLST